VVISASDSAQKAVHALKMGAYDYITKPFDTADLLTTLKRYTDRLGLKKEVSYLREELKNKLGYGEIISKTSVMEKVFELVQKVSRASSSVLVTGESGTGKELIALAIHARSERCEKPFVIVNCGAIPSDIMESELFGHEKGAFTGAHARKIGKFEYADGGTVFLDEVATLPMTLQVKLLRVLQERSFERVGGVPRGPLLQAQGCPHIFASSEGKEGGYRAPCGALYRQAQ
jgi:DNA-binding NtrC family response regulator